MRKVNRAPVTFFDWLRDNHFDPREDSPGGYAHDAWDSAIRAVRGKLDALDNVDFGMAHDIMMAILKEVSP